MKRSQWIALNSVLAAAAAVVAVLNATYVPPVFEWVPSVLHRSTRPAAQAGNLNSADSGGRRKPSDLHTPSEIAAAFDWVQPLAATAMQPAARGPKPGQKEPKLVDAPWLSLIGSITQADGTAFYYFKNEKTGAIMQLSQNRAAGGWSLKVPKPGEYVIENDSEHYLVRAEQ